MSIELSFDVHNTSSWTGNLALLEQNIQGAANLWGKVFVGSAKFRVTLNLVTSTQFLASSGPSDFILAGQSNGTNLWASSTQYSLFTNSSQNDGRSADLVVNVATNYIQDGTVVLTNNPAVRSQAAIGATHLDFISIAEHELGHAFGIFGWRDQSTGQLTGKDESLFDSHLKMGTSGLIYTGENVTAVYGASLPLAMGDIYHLGSFTNASDPLNTDLMNPFAHWGTVDSISRLDAAIMADLGYATIYDDILRLSPGVTSINAGAGNDVIFSAGPNDTIDGGTGVDRVIYSGPARDYALSVSKTGISVNDAAGHNGRDSLTNVEYIVFNDMTLDTSWFTKTMQLDAPKIAALVELYIATFNRAPDAVGLNYWGGRLNDGMTLEDIARSFFDQQESQSAYPTQLSDAAFIAKVYQNALGRAPDAAGLKYWTQELQASHVSRGCFVMALINGANAPTGNSADALYLQNKEKVGAHFALENGLNDLPAAKSVLDGVSITSASVTSSLALADSYLNLASQPTSSQFVVQLIGLPL